jgi:hypothetical protein
MPKETWSQDVTEHSNALDLEDGVFTMRDPSRNRRSAMSMLTFCINRAGKDLDEDQRRILEGAKDELRKAFGREPAEENS